MQDKVSIIIQANGSGCQANGVHVAGLINDVLAYPTHLSPHPCLGPDYSERSAGKGRGKFKLASPKKWEGP